MSDTTPPSASPPMNVVCRFEGRENGAQQWKRAREILEDMRKKRTSLALTGHASQQQQEDYPSYPSVSKLGTANEHESCENEGDRARDILERMRKRRESFSQLLVGVGHASPTPTKHSLERTESTAAISWVSSSSEEEEEAVTYIFSEEEASNCYTDYAYPGTDVDSSSSHCSISSSSVSAAGVSFFSSGGSTSASSSLLSDVSFQQSVLAALEDIRHYDMRSANIPSALTAAPLSAELTCTENRLVLQRKMPGTSRARSLYHDIGSNTQDKSYQYLKTEHGPATTRLRADLAAISERRTMLTSMLDSVRELKSQEIDFSVVASTILSTSTTAASPDDDDDDESASNKKPLSLPMTSFVMATSEQQSSTPRQTNNEPIHFDSGRWSDKDARPEDRIQPFGFPFSDLQWVGANSDASFESGDDDENIEWDTNNKVGLLTREDSTMRGSLYLSEASSTASEGSSLSLHIGFEVKKATTPLSQAATEPTKALRSAEYLKALYSPRPEEAIQAVEERRYGGLYQLAQWTQDVERLTDRTHAITRRSNLPMDDFMIPYNVEDRFCGGLYHIASQTRPPKTATSRAMI